MFKNEKTVIRKTYFTIRNFKRLSYHHYGNSPLSMIRMVYVSVFRVNTFILLEHQLDNRLDTIDLSSKFTVTRPSIEDLEKIRRLRELPREFYYDKFHGINKCYVVMHGAEPAYIHWVYVKGDINRFLKLGDDVAEVNYITTLPAFRGEKLMTNMMIYTMNDLEKNGYRKLVSVVHTLNPAALKSMLAAGFKEVRKIRTFGYLNRKYTVNA